MTEEKKDKEYTCPNCGADKPDYREPCPECGYEDKKAPPCEKK